MGSKRRVAIWYYRGREYVVMLPGWEHKVDLVFGQQSEMIDWAHSNNYVLKDGNVVNRRYYG